MHLFGYVGLKTSKALGSGKSFFKEGQGAQSPDDAGDMLYTANILTRTTQAAKTELPASARHNMNSVWHSASALRQLYDKALRTAREMPVDHCWPGTQARLICESALTTSASGDLQRIHGSKIGFGSRISVTATSR